MHYTEYEINAAINEAELVASHLAADSTPITLTNKTVITLIEGAKGHVDRIEDLEEKLDAAREALR